MAEEAKRILTIDDWKAFKGIKNPLKEDITTVQPVAAQPTVQIDEETDQKINDIVNYAKDMGMPKLATIKYVKTIFTDSSKAPENISVSFARNWIEQIEKRLNEIPDAKWPKDGEFLEVQEMIKKAGPAKDWMLFKLDETKIGKNEPKYVYFNDVSKITEEISNTLKTKGAKTIYEKVKWITSIILK